MHLVLIGGKSAKVIETMVEQNFDNVEVSIYPTISKFVEVSNVRSIDVDRFILLQDSLTRLPNRVQILESFNEYLGRHYPAAKFVSLVRDNGLLEEIRSIYISPIMIHLRADAVKSVMLMDIVSESIDVLKRKYGEKVNIDQDDSVEEVIEDANEEEKVKNDKNQKKETKRKGSLFSLFSRRDSKKTGETKKEFTPNENLSQGKSYGHEQFDGGLEDTSNKHTHKNETKEDIDESILTPEEEELDYSIFEMDGATDFGLGITLDRGSNEDKEKGNEIEHESEIEEYLSNEVEDNNVEQLDIHIEHEDNDEEYDVIDIPSNRRTEQIERIKEDIFSKGVNLPSFDIGGLTKSDNLEEIEDFFPLEGIDTLSEEYEEKSKTIVEKIVEVPVERIVEVQKIVNSSGGRKSYKNGIRTIIVTGDRKTGVTRTAINMSAHFSKTGRTLFVDFDLARKGSLLYFGLDAISLEEDRVLQGLFNLKNTNTLENVVYTFPKGGFDCLISIYGEDYKVEQIQDMQRVLTMQRQYKTIIIDCPIDNLHYLDELLLYSEVVICVESHLAGVLNTVLALSKHTENSKFSTLLFNNGQYFLSKDSDLTSFRRSMEYIQDVFSLDEQTDWGKLPVVGSVTSFDKLLSTF